MHDAAAAEAWALHIALLESAFPPKLRTDCLSLLSTAQEGATQATGPAKPLARIWRLISSSLDGRIESIVERGNLVWMPAHQPLSAISSATLSNGKLLSGVDWQANRLVDALAKQAAASVRAPRAVRCLLESARAAVKHAAALLAVVTHAANNHKVPWQRPDGTWGTRNVRDAQQPAMSTGRKQRRYKPLAEPKPLPALAGVDRCLEAAHPAKRKRAASAGRSRRRRAVSSVGCQAPRLGAMQRPVRRHAGSSSGKLRLSAVAPGVAPATARLAVRTGSERQLLFQQAAVYRIGVQSSLAAYSDDGACSSVRACMRSADCPPDPVDDLMQLHMDGLKVVWPRSVSAGSESGQLCRDTVPDQTSTCPVGQLAVPKVSTSLSNWPSISQQGPAVARSELEDAEADLALLSKGGFPVIWPRDRIGPRSAGGPGAD